ncbi:hypothetical protein WJX74_002974 [Apatococcus lobatus]|uniref:Uncharacterized protein n=1 Tax=Apatococcus lobatus TaxID=904363 RepID=A0AAW1SAJ8_9CHLO
MPATDEDIVQQLRQLLQDIDTETTTERKLRTSLEAHFSEDLTSKKQVISEEVKRYLAEADARANANGDEGDEEPESDADADSDSKSGAKKGKRKIKPELPVKKKRKASTTGGSTLSAELSEFLGVKVMQRCQVVKRLWEYIKANNLQDPENKRRIIPDDKLQTLFTTPLDQLNMNKQLTRHILPKDPDAPPPTPKEKKPQKTPLDGEAKPATGLTKPVRVSPELGAWLGGVTAISRPQLTAAFWKYVKENGLQDPSNKKNIISDAKLKQLTGEDSFGGFGFMKLFSPHIIKD